ncbi:MAG: PAS domain S-box protein [Candidatus Binatus sp.]|uniref:PAS domain S-box protein n=1 Tax=Candidatus Binatus sp. TaxID=2811406 RepID=UPI002725BAAB|nr:PAS domain S-box protein [Candidatus Binatus sp.]MDO8434476.1 PAS domain S-box protein [Candidatus Binatus sp.]
MSQPPKIDPLAPAAQRDTALTMDSAGLVIEWSDDAEAIFGWSSADAIGRRLSELIIPERLRSMHEAGLKRFMAGGPGTVLNRAIEIAAIDRDGREFTVEVHITPEKTAHELRFATSVRKL